MDDRIEVFAKRMGRTSDPTARARAFAETLLAAAPDDRETLERLCVLLTLPAEPRAMRRLSDAACEALRDTLGSNMPAWHRP